VTAHCDKLCNNRIHVAVIWVMTSRTGVAGCQRFGETKFHFTLKTEAARSSEALLSYHISSLRTVIAQRNTWKPEIWQQRIFVCNK